MFKSTLTATAFALIAGISHANPVTFNLPLDSATADLEFTLQTEEELNYCEWVTLYDFYGNWVTVWQCY